MRVVSVGFACVLSAGLGGCAIFADPNAWPQKFHYGDSANLASGTNVRYVNERWREMAGREDQPLPTMCTEPAPDVAVAFGTSLAASANISGQGSGGFGANTSEAALALAGRTASVLALRDGLYATCQAYTNGALGQSAYALGLSQYGNLLVALTAHDAGAPGGTSAGAAGAPITISIPTVAPKTGSDESNPGTRKIPARFANAGDDDHPPLILVDGTDTATKKVTTPGSATPDPSIFTPNDSARTALMVACISEYDPTRIGARNPGNGPPAYSGVLSEAFCREYIARLSRRLAVAIAAKK
jgi:hypothetical protein